jgi:hypothetical protein
VVEAADRLGYRPNRAARALPKGRTFTIGYCIPAGRDGLFLDTFLHQVTERASDADMDILLFTARPGPSTAPDPTGKGDEPGRKRRDRVCGWDSHRCQTEASAQALVMDTAEGHPGDGTLGRGGLRCKPNPRLQVRPLVEPEDPGDG